jgi:hypothetical protein
MANEINRILKLFAALQHGDCWIGTNFKEVLQGVDAALAARDMAGSTNSDNPPPFPDFHLPENYTEEAWRQALHDFEAAYHLLRNAIHHFKEEHLDKPSPKPTQTFYELIMGCLQHDAYHLGQMMLLKKSVKG